MLFIVIFFHFLFCFVLLWLLCPEKTYQIEANNSLSISITRNTLPSSVRTGLARELENEERKRRKRKKKKEKRKKKKEKRNHWERKRRKQNEKKEMTKINPTSRGVGLGRDFFFFFFFFLTNPIVFVRPRGTICHIIKVNQS